MRLFVGLASVALLILVLRDSFETVILPRRVQRRFRLTALFYGTTWRLWRGFAMHLPRRIRQNSFGWFGPASLLLLLAVWALGMVAAFAGLHWANLSALHVTGRAPGVLDDLYLSGTTFFTLGIGDVVPGDDVGRILVVVEAGLGFAFLAVIIGYLPVIYQAFSRREIAISMLDARAGSPPAAGELLWRQRGQEGKEELTRLLAEWEHWAAEVLESHLSYPVLAYFRSQHGNQSWLAALTTVLDTSALVMVGLEGWCLRQARLTFAMARHAAVDLAQVFSVRRPATVPERLPEAEFTQLLEHLANAGMRFTVSEARAQLKELRELYEPYVVALSNHLVLPLPGWNRHSSDKRDNWEAAPWKVQHHTPGPEAEADHF